MFSLVERIQIWWAHCEKLVLGWSLWFTKGIYYLCVSKYAELDLKNVSNHSKPFPTVSIIRKFILEAPLPHSCKVPLMILRNEVDFRATVHYIVNRLSKDQITTSKSRYVSSTEAPPVWKAKKQILSCVRKVFKGILLQVVLRLVFTVFREEVDKKCMVLKL